MLCQTFSRGLFLPRMLFGRLVTADDAEAMSKATIIVPADAASSSPSCVS